MTETQKDENLREFSKQKNKQEENRRESWSAQNKQMVQ